ncbi:MAG: hypothetical protein MUE46_15505 [Xanthomonadales bacterium]|jgi:ppGpp synthetase/RelA/SpoT-type nucleotidyltranferase|nr:hypothetical protein [Xanthomonadales bacterium]
MDFEAEKQKFNENYEKNIALRTDAVAALKNILQLLLSEKTELLTTSGRVKDRDECIAKFQNKYLKDLESSGATYTIEDYITDLIGLRVVCLYEKDVQAIRNAIRQDFEVLEETDKTAILEKHDDTFGYKGVHLDLRLKAPRSELPEYIRFKDIRFELQIRTTIQDAWSILDHKIKYKKNIPYQLKRRINRLAALFELADQEFLNIRMETLNYENNSSLSGGVGTPTVSQTEPPSRINAFSFMALAREHFPNYPFDESRIDTLVSEMLLANPEASLDQVITTLQNHLPEIAEYRTFQTSSGNNLNPLTSIRHAMYLGDKARFKGMLFAKQRANFECWLENKARQNATNIEQS